MSEKTKLLNRSPSNGGYGTVAGTKGLAEDLSEPNTSFTKRDCIIVAVVAVLALVAIITTLVLGLPQISEKRARYSNITFSASPSQLGQYRQAAVTSTGSRAHPLAVIFY